jgi:hypothetical protein
MSCRHPGIPALGSFSILILLAGCADSRSTGQGDAVIPRWRGTAGLTLGSLEGANDQLAAPSGIAADARGRIFVADEDNHTIVVFDSTGRYLFNIGREGSGPGELKGPCCLAMDSAGNLWVRDAFNSRYSRYQVGDSSALLTENRRTQNVGAVRSALTFDAEGRVVDVVARPSADRRMTLLRYHLGPTGPMGRVDTIQGPPPDSLGVFQFPLSGSSYGFINQPYGPRLLLAHAPGGGWAEGISSRYLIRWTVDGDTSNVRTIRRDLIGPALSARERQEADATLKAQASELGLAPGRIPFGVPGSKTPVYGIMFDRQGRLWVQLNVGDGENSRADVWDPSGRRVANVEWPAGIDLRSGFIHDRMAYGTQQDSAGVPHVVKVTFAGP